jgi:glycolate oxidase subunit GlcD
VNKNELVEIFTADRVKTSAEDLKKYGRDWTTYFDIQASAIVFPVSAEEVRSLVLWARKNKVALIPSGGRTGLSGGACALNGEVVVSFERMNKILHFDPIEQTVELQAGVITEELQNFARQKGLYYPVDFAARGSSQIGGNIATNAGGIKVVRYGLTRDWVSSLKVVTGTGEILELNQSLVKNATGYDLRHLFIGSEGTLGFVVEATIKLAPPPPAVKVLLLGADSLPKVMEVFAIFKKKNVLTAFEMFSHKALVHVLSSTGLTNPLSSECAYYVVTEIECATSSQEDVIMACLEEAMEKGLLLDGAISQSEVQAKNFWRLREDISESLSKYSPYKNDISVRISKVPQLIHELDPIFAKNYPQWEVVWFGHIGDGNLHINILRPANLSKEDFVKECRKVDELVFTAVKNQSGSISAEHGVGLTKKAFLQFSRSASEIELMKSIKNVFDPDRIVNPGKLVD